MLLQLKRLEEKGKPIRVSLIGCGRFGSMMLAQIMRARGMTVAVACDLMEQRAYEALKRGGYDVYRTTSVRNASEANDIIRKGRTVVTDRVDVAIEADVDVVVEATGNPDAGTRHALGAILSGKHVVMVNVEADVLVGPMLKLIADRNGVVYSLAYGDQPAIIEELYDWAISLGFEVIAAGKGTQFLPEYRKGTPIDALVRYGYSAEDAARSDLNPKMYNSFFDGTKSAVEMCSVSNMTGLVPDVPGMHFPPGSIEQLPTLLRPENEGGILSQKGVVEVVSSLCRDGSEIPNSLRWGVYVILSCDSQYLLNCLHEYGMTMDSTGRYAVMYRPYHLVGMETPVSIARTFLFNQPTGAPIGHVGEVVAVAKRTLQCGELLDGEGGYTVYGALVEANQASYGNLLPIGLCYGAKIICSVPEDQSLTYSDVELPPGGLAQSLREPHQVFGVESDAIRISPI